MSAKRKIAYIKRNEDNSLNFRIEVDDLTVYRLTDYNHDVYAWYDYDTYSLRVGGTFIQNSFFVDAIVYDRAEWDEAEIITVKEYDEDPRCLEMVQ